MTFRNLWISTGTRLPKLQRTVYEGNITLRESDPVFVMVQFGTTIDYVAAVYRKATEITNGKEVTADEYFAPIQGVFADGRATGCDMLGVKAWMYPPRPDAIDADWLIDQMNGDCDYCEHLTNIRDTSPCMNCIHAPVGAIVPDGTQRNNWTLTKTYRPSIEERTVYPE